MRLTIAISALLFFTLKVFSQPSIDWYRTYDDEQHYLDGSTCAVMDDAGNIYVSGEAYNYYSRSSEYDIVTIKYSPAGDQLWLRKYHNYNYDGAVKMYYHSNNIYVLGWSQDSITYNMNSIVLKYDVNGNLVWLKRIGNISYFMYQPADMIADYNFENFYLTGYYYNNDSSQGVIHKLNKYGSIVWETRIRYQQYDNTVFLKSSLSQSGNILSCGNVSMNYPNYDPKSLFVKIGLNGNVLWSRTDSIKYVVDVVRNQQDEKFILSISPAYEYHTNFNVSKLNSSDSLVWNISRTGTYHLTSYYNLFPVQKFIEIDNQQNVIVAYSCETNQNRNSLSVYKFDRDANEIWQYSDTSIIKPTSVVIDNFNNIYVSTICYFYRNTNQSYLTKLSSSGNLIWKAGNISIYRYDFAPYGLIVKENIIVLSGYSNYMYLGRSDYLTVKYTQPIGIQPISSEIPDKFSLSQNYPNPFNPVTKILFNIPLWPAFRRGVDAEGRRGVLIKLIIYDILGREIKILVNEQLKPGTYEVEFDGTDLPSGVYFYKLITKDFLETKKMVLIK